MRKKPTDLFRHKYGGIYRLHAKAKHSETLEELCIYEHLWPFEPGEMWARPAKEWEGKFTPISMQDFLNAVKAVQGNQEAAQQAVNAAKAAARAAKKDRHDH